MRISAEIEALNTRNLRAQQQAAAERQRELHQYLTSTLVGKPGAWVDRGHWPR